MSGIASVADAFARATDAAGGPETVKRGGELEKKRTHILSRYERVHDAWASGLEPIDWLAAEQERRDAALADLDAELAQHPAAPDPDAYAASGAHLREIGDTLPQLDESTLPPSSLN